MKRIRHFITLLALTYMIAGQVLTSYATDAANKAAGGSTGNAAAHSTVTYDCNSHIFIMEPGSKESPTDLFANFKDIIPGQTLTQEIVVGNDEKSDMISKVYLRSLGATEQSKEFLKQLKLKVSVIDSGTAKKEISIGTADEPHQLTDWVCLGELEPGHSVTLSLILEVPVTLDNKFQEAVGTLHWEFRSEELPIPEDKPEEIPEPTPATSKPGRAPTTGDSTSVILYLLMLCLSVAVFWGIWASADLGSRKK